MTLTALPDRVRGALAPIDQPAWLVGGAVRDHLAGSEIRDVDLAIAGDAGRAARDLAAAHGAVRFALSEAFGSWRITGGGLPFDVDITPLQGADIAGDLARRDLTVNAIAIALSGDAAVLDPHGGRDDLREGVLRMVDPDAFRNDPVRLVRLARLSCQLGFTVDPETALRARMDAPHLTRAAGERVLEELRVLSRLPDAWRGVETLDDIGVLGVLLPELEEGRGLEQTPYHHLDVLGHTLEVVRHVCAIRADPAAVFCDSAAALARALGEPLADGITRGDALVFAALFHDMAKPATYAVTAEGRATFFGHDRLGADMADEWCSAHHSSTRFREAMSCCVREHLRLGFMVHAQPLSLRRIVRYLDATGGADAELLVLSCADRLATDGPRTTPSQITRHLDVARQVARAMFDLRSRPVPRPLLNGLELADIAGRAPGPWTARLVAALREEQVIGLVTTRDRAVRFAREWLNREDVADG